ncbi:MAG TPA: PH domain-containing protein [Propionibacteriaceae bacterium]|nr:PH domain-containing protein [Propionibacteriaceae bacterium]
MTSEAQVPESVTLRSMPALITGAVLSVIVVAGSVALWIGMGPITRSQWTWPQLVTIVFFLIVLVATMMAVGLSVVKVGPDGVTVRNAISTHHYTWDRVDDFVMNSGDPWVNLELRDDNDEGATRMVLAVQRSEGDAAEERLALLQAIARRYKTA